MTNTNKANKSNLMINLPKSNVNTVREDLTRRAHILMNLTGATWNQAQSQASAMQKINKTAMCLEVLKAERKVSLEVMQSLTGWNPKTTKRSMRRIASKGVIYNTADKSFYYFPRAILTRSEQIGLGFSF